jgi:hypothetical protein
MKADFHVTYKLLKRVCLQSAGACLKLRIVYELSILY